MTFGERVKKMRLKRGLTQQQCADAVGIERAAWAGCESKNKKPRDEKTIVKMANVLNTSVDYLMGNTDDPRPLEEIKQELEQYKKQVPDLLEYAKMKRPTFRGKIITEEEAKEYNKLFDMFLDMLEAKAEKNAKSGMINAS
jgi:transcriptional regulator with XRE-family HTH domain